MIDVRDLTFRYVGRRRPTLRNVTFSLARGESLLVLGPSGCGKSTLALCLNGAIPHFVEGDLTGSVVVDGVDTRALPQAALAQRVGIVFQDPEAQFCMLTVEDEVAFGLENLAVPRNEMDQRIDEALALVGLGHRRRDRIAQLSGGQKQRLALASVLALRPEVIVFDEPTAQLDPAGAAEVVAMLDALRTRGQHTIVVVEHRLDSLMQLVDRVLVLGSTGEVVAFGQPREVLHQQSARLADDGVWVPQVSELAAALERRGVPVHPFPLTVAEAAEALSPFADALRAEPTPPVSLVDAPDATASETASRAPIFDVRKLGHHYPHADRPTLRDVAFSLRPGELVSLVGANGAGKSTLARHLVRLIVPPAGAVRLRNADLRSLPLEVVTRSVGYVFQYPEHQFVGNSVSDDVAYGLRRARLPEAEVAQRTQEMLEDFGLAHLGPAHPFTLSHGEQRRLSVASMLVLDQAALLLDEPTFGQDRRNAAMIATKLNTLASAGKLVLAITHDMRFVAERARRVLVLDGGVLIYDGTPAALFADEALLRRARLVPPPLWELSQRLRLPAPIVSVDDFVDAVIRTRPTAPVVRSGGGAT